MRCCCNPATVGQRQKKFAVDPSDAGIPVDPAAQKTERLGCSRSSWLVRGEKLAQKAVELALAGNVKCLQLCLDRLMPRRVGRPVDFTLPAVNDARDVVAAMAAITTAVNDGNLTAEEAGQLVHILNGYAALEIYDFAKRIAALESRTEKRP